jgi:hypothetical protein
MAESAAFPLLPLPAPVPDCNEVAIIGDGAATPGRARAA